MTKIITWIMAVCVVLGFLTGCNTASEMEALADREESPVSMLHVKENLLKNTQGDTVVLRGMSSHGIGWYPRYINSGAMETLKDYGANVIRLALYSETTAGYLNEPYSLDILYIGIENAIAQNMYVIVDWHILDDYNPLIHADEAIAFFEEISRRYGDCPNVIYEICNEPNGDTSWEDITKYANWVIPVIRENAPESIVLVGTPKYSSQIQEAMAQPLPYKNVMYSYHKYVDVSPTAEEMNLYLLEKAVAEKFPIFVTEWGITFGNEDADRDKEVLLNQYREAEMENAVDFLAFLQEHQISWCGWELSNSTSIHAAVFWYCDKLHGWTPEDLTPGGNLMFSAFRDKET